MNVTEMISKLSALDKKAPVIVAWSVGNGIVRERKSISVKSVGESVQIIGESRPAAAPKPAKAAAAKSKLTLVKSAAKSTPAKSAAKPRKAANTSPKRAAK